MQRLFIYFILHSSIGEQLPAIFLPHPQERLQHGLVMEQTELLWRKAWNALKMEWKVTN